MHSRHAPHLAVESLKLLGAVGEGNDLSWADKGEILRRGKTKTKVKK
jgi:hypothetical protein